MRKSIASFAISVALAVLSGPVKAECGPHHWGLLGYEVHSDGVVLRDTAKDADMEAVCREGFPIIPTFETKEECEAGLRHAIRKYAGKGAANGEYGSYLCADLRTWAHG
jgi:hypothetical protein